MMSFGTTIKIASFIHINIIKYNKIPCRNTVSIRDETSFCIKIGFIYWIVQSGLLLVRKGKYFFMIVQYSTGKVEKKTIPLIDGKVFFYKINSNFPGAVNHWEKKKTSANTLLRILPTFAGRVFFVKILFQIKIFRTLVVSIIGSPLQNNSNSFQPMIVNLLTAIGASIGSSSPRLYLPATRATCAVWKII